jgi:hypothetical protein
MLHSETWALVPVKRFSRAKSRLCEILFERERADLAQTMLRDVLQNLKMTSALLKSDRIGKDIDSALDFAPYLLSSDDLGLTGSFLEKLDISERFGIDDAPAPLRLI